MDPYENLRKELNKIDSWPMLYMFKFIISSDNQTRALVVSKFSSESVITTKESTNGKYTSVTVKEVMMDAESIIAKYKEFEGIPGLISL
jgi:putative lipoic acid-binding regulatory protein